MAGPRARAAVTLTRRGPKVQVTVAEDGVPGPEDDTEAELTSALLLPVLEDVDSAAGQYVGTVGDFDLGLTDRTDTACPAAYGDDRSVLGRLAAETTGSTCTTK